MPESATQKSELAPALRDEGKLSGHRGVGDQGVQSTTGGSSHHQFEAEALLWESLQQGTPGWALL